MSYLRYIYVQLHSPICYFKNPSLSMCLICALAFKMSLFLYLYQLHVYNTPSPQNNCIFMSATTLFHIHNNPSSYFFFFKQLESSAFFEEEILEGNPCWKTGRDDRRRDEDCRGRLLRDAILMLSQVC